MPILKLEIFQNSKSQKCKLWGRPPPLFGKSLHFEFFFMTASLREAFHKKNYWNIIGIFDQGGLIDSDFREQ